jgi:hypothetical protein
MASNSGSSSGGIGIAGVLTIVFVVLKLVGVIAWSWWWVLSPLWISFGLFLLIVVPIAVALKGKRQATRTPCGEPGHDRPTAISRPPNQTP